MQQIDVDFDVWKALTALRRSEQHSYNEVLRGLLDLPTPSAGGLGSEASGPIAGTGTGCVLGGRFLPDGSRLRAKYKGVWYHAEIRDGRLIDGEGKTHSSSSAAARAVTKTNVNGLLFWEARRPSDGEWRKIAALPRAG